MPLTIPQLDDRSYQDLLDEALDRIHKDLKTDWNDLSPGDPGVVLLEAFAFLTEQMLYRLNRLPEKAYIAFLNLLGTSLYPPSAARASLRFERPKADVSSKTIFLGRGTMIRPGGGGDDRLANAFVLAEDLEIPPKSDGSAVVNAIAYHCELVEEELGVSNGLPGQSFTVQRPPLIAALGNWLDLVVGVEVPSAEQQPGDKEGTDGRLYRPWQEVDRFSPSETNSPDHTYTVDRTSGVIQFAPAARGKPAALSLEPETHSSRQAVALLKPIPPAGREAVARFEPIPPDRRHVFTLLGEIPPAGKRIRAWYARGGGESGNLPAGTLTEILNPPGEWQAAGVTVTNPEAAWGGVDGEMLSNALVRGPHEFFSDGNVVTGRDYEALVLGRGSMARARAYARRALWTYAQPGTVEIALLPWLPDDKRESFTPKDLKDNERAEYLPPILRELDARKPLGTRCELVWAGYKKLTIDAKLVIRSKDRSNVGERKKRVEEALYRLLSPFPPQNRTNGSPANSPTTGISHEGWPFGQELRLAQVYQQILSTERDITLISQLAVRIEEAPDCDIRCLAADNFQPDTWYAASAERLFRSTNNGQGWENILAFTRKDPPKDEAVGAGRLYVSGRRGGRQVWTEIAERRWERVMVVCPGTEQPGVVAVATRLENGDAALYVSANCGETWYRLISHFDGAIEDMAWLPRGNRHVLLLATSCGLYELGLVFWSGEPELALDGNPPAGPVPDTDVEIMPRLAPVDPDRPTLALYAVAVITRDSGNGRVAVAARNRQGVYLSRSDDLMMVPRQTEDNGKAADRMPLIRTREVRHEQVPAASQAESKTDARDENARSNFAYLGLRGEDVRHLNVQKHNDHIFLWAGAMAVGNVGRGCYRWKFDTNLHEGEIVSVDKDWTGGSCHALAFQGSKVLAATAWGGILTANLNSDGWTGMNDADSHLPRRILRLDQEAHFVEENLARRDFSPLVALASNNSAARSSDTPPTLMTGGAKGVYRHVEEKGPGESDFEKACRTEFLSLRDVVTLPPNWIFVSGNHTVTISYEDAQPNDQGDTHESQ